MIYNFLFIFQTTDDDNGNEDNTDAEWQAEEAIERRSSPLTESKWRHYGTQERVQESRRQQLNLHRSSRKYPFKIIFIIQSIPLNEDTSRANIFRYSGDLDVSTGRIVIVMS